MGALRCIPSSPMKQGTAVASQTLCTPGFRGMPPPLAPSHGRPDPVFVHDEPAGIAHPHEGTPSQFRPTLLDRLLAAPSAAARRTAVTEMLGASGFEWLGYGRMRQVGDQVVPLSFCVSYANESWVRRYFHNGYHRVDPRLPRALHSALPYVWTLKTLREQPAPQGNGQQLQRFVDDLDACGIHCGAMLSLPGQGHERGYVSLLSHSRESAWIDDAVLGRVLTLAMCLHEFYSRYAPPPAAAASPHSAHPALTPLQRQILALLANGLADKQIADRLQLSLHNVDYHLRRLRQRFGVRNRIQLMQAAARDALPDAGQA